MVRARSLVILSVLVCCLALVTATSRKLHQSPAPSYGTLAEALSAAATSAPNLSILVKALQASGVASSVPANAAWTILAPTDDAFTSRLQSDLGITPDQLLAPQNNQTLVDVLSYHVIPAGALTSTQLTDGQQLQTALQGAAPLTVRLASGNVTFEGATDSATVIVPDVLAGSSIVHVVDDVLLPASVPQSAG